MQKLLIIGGVAAGATAAARARRVSANLDITMLEAGKDISFANCGLPYYLGGDIESRSRLILQSPESFEKEFRVRVNIETGVLAIDPAAKTVQARHLPSGDLKEYSYDTLILTQGGKPLVPPIPGADDARVFSLWTLPDMDRIDNHIKTARPETAVIVGAGFIGLEMAEAFVKRGLKVHVVEKQPQIMPLLEAEIAGFLTTELLRHGVDLHCSKGVQAISEDSVVLDDGSSIKADLVLMSIGVRPELSLARAAGLELGPAGGLLVDKYLRTSDPHIFAAGDMLEIEHRVHGQKVRIPLAGPANRQGRIAASNALGQNLVYPGSLGTSVVKVFEAVAGSSGLNMHQAKEAGFKAEAITVHKEHHTAYYPGAKQVSLHLVYDSASGRILGGQTAGYAGADRRIDVVATALAGKMTVHDLAGLDLAYSPPLGTANDVVNMAAFAAENRLSGYSPCVLASELDEYLQGLQDSGETVLIADLRDPFAFGAGRVDSAGNYSEQQLKQHLAGLDLGTPVLLYDDNGKLAHRVLRSLVQAGYNRVRYVSGGFRSLELHGRSRGYRSVSLLLPELVMVDASDVFAEMEPADSSSVKDPDGVSAAGSTGSGIPAVGSLVIDVRTQAEYLQGAFPEALNIPLDSLEARIADLGAKDREILVYCASGARSSYAVRLLQDRGFSKARNAGGLADIMREQTSS